MNSWLRNPARIFCLILVWRVFLLIFTAQPIPANDAFGYDGGVVNYLHGGGYCNPSFAIVFPISGKEMYATYPPLYQAALFVWMKLFGTSVIAAMSLHLVLFAISGFLTLVIVKRFFPASASGGVIAWLFFGFTFGDRPESLAYLFGLAALWLTAKQISERGGRLTTMAGLTLTLLLGLYTSVLVGAYFFGVGFLACAIAYFWRRQLHWFVSYAVAAILFAVIALCIAKLEPRWWAGFQESAQQQTVAFIGFHKPYGSDLLKLARTAPLFLVGLVFLPVILTRRQDVFSGEPVWLALCVGIFVAGWGLLVAALTLLSSNYVNFVMFTQILFAAGLLALVQKYLPAREKMLRAVLVGCVLVVSIRAIGMTTWGVACAFHNSYRSTQITLHDELGPFTQANAPVLLSSAFLYQAEDLGVKNPVHCDWYFDHARWTNNAELNGLALLRPPRIILTQFDYYRGFAPVLEQLAQHPELAEFQVRNLAVVRPPDAIPALSRIVQHVSWAPVIVDINWKNRPAAAP